MDDFYTTTWVLFHSIGQQIKNADFYMIGKDLLQIIRNICENFPCNECSDHSIKYFESLDFNNIQTSDDFIEFLWNFHNYVNSNKGLDFFPKDKLNIYYCFDINILFRKIFFQLYNYNVDFITYNSGPGIKPYDIKYYTELESFYYKNKNCFTQFRRLE